MTVVPFDTLALARKRRDDAKMTQEQAEGIAKALAEAMSGADVATRADLAPLATSAQVAEVEAKITGVKGEVAGVKAEIAGVELRLEAKIESAKSDILKSVMSLLLTVVTINAALVLGAMFGLAKLLGH